MGIDRGEIVNSTGYRVCWNGQRGLLVISREAKLQNTPIKCLAQGDN